MVRFCDVSIEVRAWVLLLMLVTLACLVDNNNILK